MNTDVTPDAGIGDGRPHFAAGPPRSPEQLLHALAWDPPPGGAATPDRPLIDETLLARAGARLDEFAHALSQQERATLSALLELAAGDAPFTALAAEPASAALTPREAAVYEQLRAEPPPPTALRSSIVLIVKGTRLCDLRCTYCYSWAEGPNQVMTFPVLARMTRDVLRAPGVRSVEFVWHGGEPTLLPLSFYRKALWLQQQFRRSGQQVENRIQTNAAHIKDEWIAFWRRYRFTVGVSLDGPPEVHDRRRVDTKGRPTSARVRAGLARLQDAGLDPSVYVVVDDDIVALGPARLLDYLLELGVSRAGVLNVVPGSAATAGSGDIYLAWPRYVEFLRGLFRLWWPEHAGRIVFRELADLVSQVAGQRPLVCLFAGDCHGGFFTVEPTGVISGCDKFIGDDDHRFGNLITIGLADAAASPRLAAIRAENDDAVAHVRDCPWFAACHGGCPHDRYATGRSLPGLMDRCCGLAPLLGDIAAALGAAGLPVHAGPDVIGLRVTAR